MIVARDLAPAQLDSPLGRTSPVLKLAIAIVWFVGLATTTAIAPPLVIVGVAALAAFTLGNVMLGDFVRAVAPIWIAAVGLATFNTLFAAANGDPAAATIAQLGPFRITGTGARGRRRTRPPADRDRRGRSGLRPDHGLDPAGRRARPAGGRLAQVRLWRVGGLSGHPPVRRGPHDAPAGPPPSRAPRRLASAIAGQPARPGDPPRRPGRAGDGRAGGSPSAMIGG